ncbi:MAG: winged helix DNA-binding domain-containing protein [Anaerolineae bacterium]
MSLVKTLAEAASSSPAPRSNPALRQAGIGVEVAGTVFSTILMHAELEGVVCSGGRRGKQFTYALLDERAPQARTLERDEALAELVRRYFTSHGPALVKDFVWWSGLTVADATAGLDAAKSQLERAVVDGKTYWLAPPPHTYTDASPTAYLLPNYDEYTVSYKDRSAFYNPIHDDKAGARENFLFNHAIIIDGQVVGSWRRKFEKGNAVLDLAPFAPLSAAERTAVDAAMRRFSDFLGMPVVFA